MNNELLKQDLIEAYLEAYNRECKRVDELTEERDHWLETAKSHGTKIRELEGLLKDIKSTMKMADKFPAIVYEIESLNL